MPIERLEDCAQKTVCQQHARRSNIDDSDALLGRNGLEKVSTLWSAGGDAGAFALRIARIQYIDGYVFLNRRQHRRRMQHFGSEVGQLRRLIEADDLDASCFGTDIWISGHHAVNI